MCSEFNGTQEAIPESYSTTCRWETEGLSACNGLGPVSIFFTVEFICGDENDPCGVRLWAEDSNTGLGMLWETIIPFEDFDPLATSYTLPVKESHGVWYYCNWDNSWLTIDVTLIDPLPFTVFKHCYNIQPCKYPPISLPPVDERNCLQITLCCGCPCCCGESNMIPAPAIPSPGECSSCSTDTCSYVVNVISGSVGLGLGIPKSDPMAPAVAVTIISGPLVYRSDLRTQRIEEIDECNVYVHRCDGSRQLYYCKDDEGWYTPLGNITNNSLQEQEAGGWVETAPSGQTFHYESTGPLFKIMNACNDVWTIVRSGSIQSIILPDNRRVTSSYTGTNNDRLQWIKDPYNRITSFTSDSNGNITQHTTPELCVTSFRYDVNNRLKAIIAPDSCRTSFAYDAIQGLIKSVQTPRNGRYTYSYADYWNLSVMTPDGGSTAVLFDNFHNIVGTTGPLGEQTVWAYDRRYASSYTDAAGNVSTLSYDRQSDHTLKMTRMSRPGNHLVTYTYDVDGLLKSVINPLGHRTTSVRDVNGFKVATIDALGKRTTTVYSDGRPVATVNPLGHRTTAVYNSYNQMLATVSPLGHRASFTYAYGQRTTVKNPLGQRTTTLYDLSNRILANVAPNAARTSFVYDTGCQRKAEISPEGNRTSYLYNCGLPTATINPLGHRTSFVYDTSGRRIRLITPLGRISTTVYDSAGRTVAGVSPAGLRTTTIYKSGRPVATVSPDGLRTTTIYDTCCSQPKAMIAPNGARTSYTYNAVNQQIRMTAPTGAISTTIYDAVNRTIASIDPLGKRTSTIYDAASRTIASVNALNQRSTTVYNAANQAVASINALGFRTTQVYDAASRGVASINPKGNRWTTVYDLASRTIASVDPLTQRTTTVYNQNSAVIATINPAGSRNTTVYNIAGQTIASVNAIGARSTTTYNADGQTVASINALGYRTTNIYDTGGRGVATVDARGNRASTVYDTKGRPAASINPLGKRWSTIFNTVGQTVASKDPLGNRNTTVYDTAGRVFANINPLGKRATTVYNIASQSLATIDANGNRVSSVYDALGRRNVEVNANGGRTTTVFDAVGQTSALVDARGNRNSFTYDSTDVQTQLIDPLNRRTTNAYDAAGQQTLRIDARSNRTSFAYSTVGQLTNRKYPNGTRATLSYDTVGNRTVMADSTGRYTATYDAVGQTTVTASPNSQRQTFSYDTVGQRRSMDATGAGRFTYQYDAANQISSLLNPYSERTTFGYDDAGRRNLQRNANGTRVSLSYDAASQTTQVFHRTSAGASVLQLDYRYDNAGNRKSMIENVSAARTTWTYDKQNQLLGEYRTGTNPYRQTFTYDAASNRTLKNIDTVRTTYAYDVANQLKYGQAVAGRTSFAYDATGNQRIEQPPTGNRTTTTWNYENQPTQYRLPTGSPVTMSYNGDNRRVISQQGATSTKFVWDSTTDAYLSELNAANAVQAVYTNEPQHYGSVVSQRRSSTSHWLHADALGTTRLLTNSTQTTSDTYLLDAWGNPITSSGTTVNPFRWVGRYGYYQDSSTGMVYVRARIYQPTVGRWLSFDPIGNGNRASCFVYAHSNSIWFVDPSGVISYPVDMMYLINPQISSRFEPVTYGDHSTLRISDNSALDGFTPFSQEKDATRRCSNVPPTCLLSELTQGQLKKKIIGNGGPIKRLILGGAAKFKRCKGFEWIDMNGELGCTQTEGHCGCWCFGTCTRPVLWPMQVCKLRVNYRLFLLGIGWLPWDRITISHPKDLGLIRPITPFGIIEAFGEAVCCPSRRHRYGGRGKVTWIDSNHCFSPADIKEDMNSKWPGISDPWRFEVDCEKAIELFTQLRLDDDANRPIE